MKRETSKLSTPRLNRRLMQRVRVAVIRAEYNSEITLSLEQRCVLGLREAGLRSDQIECIAVPGCFEIPLAAQRLALGKRFDALIALGAVIQGETLHFELVAGECARGVMAVSIKHNIPVIFEVLATRNRRDALRRAGKNRANKGYEAAAAAISMLAALETLKD
ncbi:MAG: 6,7-dimethyl-8-ribityllumazine synthase [Acidobacteriota bacterium]|nr:6,7-dimethyl-8-ribityllumazine synthase [Acidobacteriota bacterium]